jgi:hypothetical protein
MPNYLIFLGGEALLLTNYVQNICPKRAINNNKTPYELWFGHELEFSNLKVFGCKSHVLIYKKLTHKLDTHLVKCIFLGYNDGSKAYLLMKNKNKRIVISQNVIFDEIFVKKIEPILHVEDDVDIILDANLFKDLTMEPTNQGQPIHLPPCGVTKQLNYKQQKKLYYVTIQFVTTCDYLSFATMFYNFYK